MSPDRRLLGLEAELARAVALVAVPGPAARPALSAAFDSGFIDEVSASVRLAGFPLERAEVAALVGRGVVLGGRTLATYEVVADYAHAARFVAGGEPAGARTPRPFIQTGEILELHRRACRRTLESAGSWRERNVPAVRSGLVPPPHWLVPREIATFVDRFAGGPGARPQPLRWVASAHARLLRIQPFAGGNGRVARLVANLLLRRCGLPQAAFGGRLEARYFPALGAADGGDVGPLAELTGDAVAASLTPLLAALNPGDALRPLRDLASQSELAGLVKAAQRGRLRVLRRGTRVLSTIAWVDEYRAGRYSPPGRR